MAKDCYYLRHKRNQELFAYLEINETLDYIHARKLNLMNWIENELRILGKYNEVEQLIVFYKEIDTKLHTWVEISRLVHYSETQCRRIYRNYKHIRSID